MHMDVDNRCDIPFGGGAIGAKGTSDVIVNLALWIGRERIVAVKNELSSANAIDDGHGGNLRNVICAPGTENQVFVEVDGLSVDVQLHIKI